MLLHCKQTKSTHVQSIYHRHWEVKAQLASSAIDDESVCNAAAAEHVTMTSPPTYDALAIQDLKHTQATYHIERIFQFS